MRDGTIVKSFEPSAAWQMDWPHGVSTVVQVKACVSGLSAAGAVREFLKPLHHNPDADVPDGVSLYYWGGFTAQVTPPVDEDVWRIVLASAGEDAFDSVQDAADALVEALRAAPGEVLLTWQELPATRVNGTP